MTKAKAGKTKRRVTDPTKLRRAVRWYIAGKGKRSLRQAVAKFKVPFEAVRKAVLAGKRRRSA